MSTPVTLPAPPGTMAPPRAAAVPAAADEYVERFDVTQRLQHILMAFTFTALAVTGLPQKFADLGASQWAISAMGGLDSTRAIHHVMAFAMLGACVWHLAYLGWVNVRTRGGGLGMLAGLQDFKDILQATLYFLGFSRTRPKFDRYTYQEKFDYWAVFWGIVIIGGSGLILLFPVAAARIMPGAMIPVAFVAHSDEAVLAVGWILIVHIFYAHLAPNVFPFNTSIFTGRRRRAELAKEHARWIARLSEDASKGG